MMFHDDDDDDDDGVLKSNSIKHTYDSLNVLKKKNHFKLDR